MTTHVLLATTCRWFSTARLAMAFAAAGCSVDIACPPAIRCCRPAPSKSPYRYYGIAPQRSIRTAILTSKPNIVIPCDDVAMRHLHGIYAVASQATDVESREICRVLQLPRGAPDSYPLTESREKFMAMVRERGPSYPGDNHCHFHGSGGAVAVCARISGRAESGWHLGRRRSKDCALFAGGLASL